MMGAANVPAETGVIIIGAGPVGLSTAISLHRFGIESVVLGDAPGTTKHPKARGCNPRTMELFRQWGIEERVRARGLPESADAAIVVESLAGAEFGRVLPEPADRNATPAWTCHVTQNVVEEELLVAATACSSTSVFFSHRVEDVQDLGSAVLVRAQGPDGPVEVRASYGVAADGAASQTRERVGIEMIGTETLATWANDFWEGDVSKHLAGRQTVSYIVVPPVEDAPTSMVFPSGQGRFLSWSRISEEDAADISRWTPERARRAVLDQIGAEEPIEMLGQAVWRMSSQVAATFRSGRFLLAGDAAHRFPPTGGLGMNTGIQDAHNLAWKLALVLRGQAGEALLDSYTTERRRIAQDNADWSVGNASRIDQLVAGVRTGNADLVAFWLKDMEDHIHQSGRALGFSYEEGALVPDGTVGRPLNSRCYEPTDRPGARFPHLWLDLSRLHSTLDWFDTTFTLVGGPDADGWEDAVHSAARIADTPITYQRLPWAALHDHCQMGPGGAVLVRPDGHVAWRTSFRPGYPADTLVGVLTRVLTR